MGPRSLLEIRRDFRSFDEAYEEPPRKLVRALSDVLSAPRGEVETYLHSRTRDERRELKAALKRVPHEPRRKSARSELRAVSRRSRSASALTYTKMLEDKVNKHMFAGTTSGEVGHWYPRTSGGHAAADLSGVQEGRREAVSQLTASASAVDQAAFGTLQGAIRGIRYLSNEARGERSEYQTGCGSHKNARRRQPKEVNHTNYPMLSKVPGLEPNVWAQSEEELYAPPRDKGDSKRLLAELEVLRDGLDFPAKPPRRTAAQGNSGVDAVRALAHMNNIAKLAGPTYSTYHELSDSAAKLADTVENRVRALERAERRGPGQHARRLPSIHDASIAAGSTLPSCPLQAVVDRKYM